MKYLLLLSMNRQRWHDMANLSPEEIKTSVGYMDVLLKELTESGEYIGGEGLGGPARMKIIQARPGGEPLITDGPMAEAKEFLAGYLEVDVPSVERAIEIAERWSTCPGKDGKPGNKPIEVHPIWADPAEDPELLAPYK
jgi:hypothetical protein